MGPGQTRLWPARPAKERFGWRLEDAPALLASAERSAARAHAAGGDRIESSTPPPPDESWDAVELEAGLRAALAGGNMSLNGTPPAAGVLHYQPIFAGGGKILGVEALLRWQHPQLGLVFPQHFLSKADFTGLILAIGPWILRTAAGEVREWQRDHRGLRLAVNLSPPELMKRTLPDEVQAALEETGFPKQLLQLEVPEGHVVSDLPRSLDILHRLKKVILPIRPGDGDRLEMLQERGRANGAHFDLVDEAGLREIEPHARSADGRALHNPETRSVDPKAVTLGMAAELRELGVEIRLGVAAWPEADGTLRVDGVPAACGHLINAAGAHADRVAHAMGVGRKYRIMPFKGAYYRLREGATVTSNGLIYPVPDLRFPFLGVHTTVTPAGKIYFGPSAAPAFGRENYSGLHGFSAADVSVIGARLLDYYVRNANGFRHYVHAEAPQLVKAGFLRAARRLVPALRGEDLQPDQKVVIRAQLVDRESGQMEMDFVIEQGPRSTHVLNAVCCPAQSAL